MFDFINLNENHEIFSNRNKRIIRRFKIETPKNIWIDEFICLRSKMHAFKCEDHSKSKLKDVSKPYSENIEFYENKKYLDGVEYQQKSHNYILRSVNHEMYLRKI